MSRSADDLSRAERRIEARPLTAEAFQAYGEVIDSAGSPSFLANGGAVEVHRDLTAIDVAEMGGRIAVSVARASPTALPLRIAVMEHHPLGSQAFVPLNGAECLIVVAPAGDLDPNAIEAFHASPAQGVNFRKGVWHHPLVALHRTSEFVVIDREGAGDNLVLEAIVAPLVIDSI